MRVGNEWEQEALIQDWGAEERRRTGRAKWTAGMLRRRLFQLRSTRTKPEQGKFFKINYLFIYFFLNARLNFPKTVASDAQLLETV